MMIVVVIIPPKFSYEYMTRVGSSIFTVGDVSSHFTNRVSFTNSCANMHERLDVFAMHFCDC